MRIQTEGKIGHFADFFQNSRLVNRFGGVFAPDKGTVPGHQYGGELGGIQSGEGKGDRVTMQRNAALNGVTGGNLYTPSRRPVPDKYVAHRIFAFTQVN